MVGIKVECVCGGDVFPQLCRSLVFQLFTRWVLFVRDVFITLLATLGIFFSKLCSWSKEICLPLAYLPDNNIFCYRSFLVENASFLFVLKSLEDFFSLLCVSRHLHRTETFLGWAIEKFKEILLCVVFLDIVFILIRERSIKLYVDRSICMIIYLFSFINPHDQVSKKMLRYQKKPNLAQNYRHFENI